MKIARKVVLTPRSGTPGDIHPEFGFAARSRRAHSAKTLMLMDPAAFLQLRAKQFSLLNHGGVTLSLARPLAEVAGIVAHFGGEALA